MSVPAWIPEIFAAIMILVAEVSAAQLAAARAWTRRGRTDADSTGSRLLTGIALAGILVPGLNPLPNTAWEVIFAATTAWSAWRLWQDSQGHGAAAVARGHYAPHLVHSAAMLYIVTALPGPSAAGSGMAMSGTGGMPGMAGGTSGGIPTLALIFALLLIASTVHDLNRRAGADGYSPVTGRPDPSAHTAKRMLLSPAVIKGCQVTTGITMAFTLIVMI